MLICNTRSPLGTSTLAGLIMTRKSLYILYWHCLNMHSEPFSWTLFIYCHTSKTSVNKPTWWYSTVCKVGYLKLKTHLCSRFSWGVWLCKCSQVMLGPLNLKLASLSTGTLGLSFVLAGLSPCEDKKSTYPCWYLCHRASCLSTIENRFPQPLMHGISPWKINLTKESVTVLGATLCLCKL